jgi:cholesterol transport system auxiliary component
MKRLTLALLLPALLTGCLGGANTPSRTYYVLQDRAAPEAAKPRAADGKSLVIAGASADVFYDAESLVFSRHPGQRAYYQFASWTDRPSRMIVRLAERRLDATGQFASVARLTTGLRADLLLNLVVVEFYHDVAVNPPVVRVELTCELIDWGSRSLLAQRTFTVSTPVKKDDAEGAADAFDRAVTDALNALVPWVGTEAAKVPAKPGRETVPDHTE